VAAPGTFAKGTDTTNGSTNGNGVATASIFTANTTATDFDLHVGENGMRSPSSVSCRESTEVMTWR